MWDSNEAFDKVLEVVNRLNQFQWKHQYIFNGVKKHNPKLYDKVTRAQDEVDNAYRAKDEARLDTALKAYESVIGEVWMIYTGKRPDYKAG